MNPINLPPENQWTHSTSKGQYILFRCPWFFSSRILQQHYNLHHGGSLLRTTSGLKQHQCAHIWTCSASLNKKPHPIVSGFLIAGSFAENDETHAMSENTARPIWTNMALGNGHLFGQVFSGQTALPTAMKAAYWEAPDVKRQRCIHLLNESWNQFKSWCSSALEHVLSGLKWAIAFKANQLPPRKRYTDINLPEFRQNMDNLPEVNVHRKFQTDVCIIPLIKWCMLSTSFYL